MVTGTGLFFSLFNNLAIFIALVAVYGFLLGYLKKYDAFVRQLLVGILFGFFAVGCMHAKIPVYEGVIVDQRNAVIALSGLCGGPVSALVSTIVAGLFRIYLGGGGVFAGVVGVCLAAIAGICLHGLFRKFDSIPKAIFGSFLASVIILPGFLLVGDLHTGWNLMKAMAMPYGTAIFMGVFLGGLLLNKQEFLYSMEKELRESEEKFKALADTSPLAIYMSEGIEQKAVYINPTFTALFGYTIDEVPCADRWWPLAYPDEQYRKQIENAWQEKVQHAIETKTTIDPMEVVVTAKNGDQKYISWGFFTIGKQNWAYGLDLTERKKAEEQKIALEMQLRQSQKMEAIGTLAGGIAHDFNNILSAILGNVDLARSMTPKDSPTATLLDKALEAINRAALLVGRILSFTRQEDAKNLVMHVGPAIEEAIKLLRPLLPSTITIHQQIHEDTRPIFANPTQVQQILLNLCTNAFHEMESTGGTLTIALRNAHLTSLDVQQHQGVQPGNFVVLSIYDSGPGIPPEIRDKIFDPYFTTKKVGKGTGMGLAIVHGIVTNWGGYIVVESESGKGAVFHIHLPAAEQMGFPDAVAEQTVVKGSERILLVDDEAIVADMSRSVLEYLGYTVTLCANGVEAFTTFQQDPMLFDVVVTDHTMPAMTGLELAQRLLAIRPDVRIIICTGYSSTVSEEKALAIGVRGFAMKPLAIQEISQLIRKVIEDENVIPDSRVSLAEDAGESVR